MTTDAVVPPTQSLRRTPLYDAHVSAGARIMPFAGWEMPVQYAGVLSEHHAVRTSAGLFDVSHMGQLVVTGVTAHDDLQRLLSNDLNRLASDGDAQYTLLTNERGGIEDDLIVYRLRPDRYLLVVNAANVGHDLHWLQVGCTDGTTNVSDVSDEWSMLALQGPVALDALADTGIDVRQLPPFQLVEARWGDVPLLVATTGYTGERGCELLLSPPAAPALWARLLSDDRVVPAGLGARDTLRLESCYPLHGSDIDTNTSAIAAGLGWACGWDSEFPGRARLLQERAHGPHLRLQALRMTDRGIPRIGNIVYSPAGEQVGRVTSGTMSPTLGAGIALAYLHRDVVPEDPVEIDVRGKRYPALVQRKPLYRRTD